MLLSRKQVEYIARLREGEKMLIVAQNQELVIECRRKSHKNKKYNGINPDMVIIDDQTKDLLSPMY